MPEPARPRLTPAARFRGAFRLVAFLTTTILLLPAFLILRLSGGSRDRWPAMGWSRIALACLGLRLQRIGTPVEAGTLAVNHISWIDPLALGAAARTFFVAKQEVRGWPGIGLLCRVGRVEFVERRPSAARRQAVRLDERLRRRHLLCIFPEGTTTDGLHLLPFRSTLFEPALAGGHAGWVQPVFLFYRPQGGGALPDSFYGWWGSMEFFSHCWDVLCQSVGGTVIVEFLAPLRARNFTDRKALAAACREALVVRMQAELPEAEAGL